MKIYELLSEAAEKPIYLHMFTYEEYSNVFKIKNKDTPIICNAFNDIIFSIPIVFMNFINGCGVKIKFKPFRILTYTKGKCIIQSTFFSPKYIMNKIKWLNRKNRLSEAKYFIYAIEPTEMNAISIKFVNDFMASVLKNNRASIINTIDAELIGDSIKLK